VSDIFQVVRNFFRRIHIDHLLILIILAVGTCLRFYRLADIPFTHDEFSAILRTQFSTFHDLIEKGIKIDGHPAGIQVFLYYIVKVFGVSEAVLKTPFILFGILSVWITFLIGKEWFNSTVGLVAASFVSFLQFPVMYSQIARPYASGLFFSLLFVLFWTRILFHPHRKYYLNLAGYILSGAICAYNHHFSMLFVTIVGITGLFICPKKWMIRYLLAGLFIILLYLPHLPILLYQLGIGGIEGWLSKPRYDFFFDYLQYIFHFSVYLYLLILVLISLSLYWYHEKPPVNIKFIFISLLWFILPYLIGFFYSRFRCSVLQYSVLIFSFPYLLFILFGWLKTDKAIHKIVLVALIGAITIPSLILERRYYELFYKGIYREIVAESKNAADSLGGNQCGIILDTRKEINPYYLEKLNCKDLKYHYLEDLKGKGNLLNWLDSCKTDYLAFGCVSATNWENYALINSRYPYLLKHVCYCGGDFYLFSRINTGKVINEYFYASVNTFEPGNQDWGWMDDKMCSDSLPMDGKKSFLNDKGAEYSPTFIKPLRDLFRNENDVIDISVDVRTPLVFPGAWLVVSVTSDGKDVKWTSAPVSDYIKPGKQGRVFQSLRLSDVELRHHRLMLSTFLWNPMKSNYMMDNFTVRVRSGNPVIYGLYRKIKL